MSLLYSTWMPHVHARGTQDRYGLGGDDLDPAAVKEVIELGMVALLQHTHTHTHTHRERERERAVAAHARQTITQHQIRFSQPCVEKS